MTTSSDEQGPVPYDPRMRLVISKYGRAYQLVWYDPYMMWRSQIVAVARAHEAIEAAARLYGHPFEDLTKLTVGTSTAR